MKVVSLFDGISCLRVALGDREVEYHASEIDPHAIKVSKTNYPDIKQLGDVRTVEKIEDVDLLCGGSPCVDLSIAKKNRKGLEGDKSSLFYEYLRVLRLIKPKWFILENVNSMPKKDRDIITKEMGVEPIMINASLVSAQCRKRLFWTNIPVVGLPEDRKILLKDILQADTEVDERMVNKGKAYTLTSTYSKVSPSEAQIKNSVEKKQRTMVKHTTKKLGFVGEHDHQANRVYDETGKSPAINTLSANGLVKIGHIGDSNGQGSRVYSPEGKSATLSANGGGGGAKTGLYQIGHIGESNHQGNRVYSDEGKSPTLTKGSSVGGPVPIKVAKSEPYQVSPYPIHIPTGSSKEIVRVGHEQRRKLDENGTRADDSNVEAIRRIETRNDDKCGTLTTVLKDNHIVNTKEFKIRKLTPIECERLQSLPDDYTKGISNTQRYRCLGNAFNVEVIKFILSFIPENGS